MLAIVTPENERRVLDVCGRWEVTATVVGRVTDSGRLRILDGWDGPVLADVAARTLHEDAPVYDRPIRRPAAQDALQVDTDLVPPDDCGAEMLALLADPSWVYRQYDHQLFLNTVVGPGSDAALLRLAGPGVPRSRPERAIALSTDGNSRWCALDPRRGTALIVAESALNVACTGATPVALVNCLNFGNPEHPEVMWQLSEAIDGMSEACRALSIPVIGGNVSLYNESRGRDIQPTPVVGTLGLVEHLQQRPPGARFGGGSTIVLIGAVDTVAPVGTTIGGLGPGIPNPTLAGSKWAVERRQHLGGRLPAVDYELHARLLSLVVGLVGSPQPLVDGIHDVSEGGLAVAVAEMAVRAGVGFSIAGVRDHVDLFGESPSRVVLSVPGSSVCEVLGLADAAGVGAVVLGRAGGDRLIIEGLVDVSLEEATAAWAGALPFALGAVTA